MKNPVANTDNVELLYNVLKVLGPTPIPDISSDALYIDKNNIGPTQHQ